MNKLKKLQDAIKNYNRKRIEHLVEKMLYNFENEKGLNLDDPKGYTHSEVVFRNLIYSLLFKGCKQYDEMNYVFYGVVIKEAMGNNFEFDKFIRDYIELALEADKKSWEVKDEEYAEWIKRASAKSGSFFLDPEDPRYNQGKAMAKYILNEM